MGGLPAGKVDRSEHDYAEWERRVDAMAVLLGRKRRLTVDERRRAIEALTPQAYDALSYYERWVSRLARPDPARPHYERRAGEEDAARSKSVADPRAQPAQFRPEIGCASSSLPPPASATRSTSVAKTGTIERYCGAFPNPEELARFARPCRRSALPGEVPAADVWPDYRGQPERRRRSRNLPTLLEKP
jgi:hypothetical protein